jgi:hypothetical protein
MTLLHKLRTLVGALAHKPFMPRPEKVELDKGPDRPQEKVERQDSSTLEAQKPEAADTERVADLIAQRQREETD